VEVLVLEYTLLKGALYNRVFLMVVLVHLSLRFCSSSRMSLVCLSSWACGGFCGWYE